MKLGEQKKSWRDIYKVHPVAEVFPILPEDELQKLGEDIKKNGLKEPITLWAPGKNDDHGDFFVLDGRNRLDAMELTGLNVIDENKNPALVLELPNFGGTDETVRCYYENAVDPYHYVISKNLLRRHLSKQEQADLIVKVMAASADAAKMARSVKRDKFGKLTGSEKNRTKQEAIEEGKKLGISKRVIERAITHMKGPTTRRPRKQSIEVEPQVPTSSELGILSGEMSQKPESIEEAVIVTPEPAECVDAQVLITRIRAFIDEQLRSANDAVRIEVAEELQRYASAIKLSGAASATSGLR